MNVRSARAAAVVLRREVGIDKTPTYDDLLCAAERMGFEVDEAVPLPWSVSTVVAHGRIGLNAELSERCRVWALAQAIGLGTDDPRPILAHHTKRTTIGTRRRWAEMFAGFVFWPGAIRDIQALLSVAPADLAYVVGLSERHASSFQHALAEEMEGASFLDRVPSFVQSFAALVPVSALLLVF